MFFRKSCLNCCYCIKTHFSYTGGRAGDYSLREKDRMEIRNKKLKLDMITPSFISCYFNYWGEGLPDNTVNAKSLADGYRYKCKDFFYFKDAIGTALPAVERMQRDKKEDRLFILALIAAVASVVGLINLSQVVKFFQDLSHIVEFLKSL